MRLSRIQTGDIVQVSKGGRKFHAHVKEIREGVVHVAPIERGITYRHAGAREILDVWHRRRARPTPDEYEPEPAPEVSKAQLSLAGRLDQPPGRDGGPSHP